jgi:hypothetical protein
VGSERKKIIVIAAAIRTTKTKKLAVGVPERNQPQAYSSLCRNEKKKNSKI